MAGIDSYKRNLTKFGEVDSLNKRTISSDTNIQFTIRMKRKQNGIYVLPASTGFEEISALEPDGVFFSNGPGDPATADGPVAVLRQVLAAGIPYFGICFGNQLFGRALGFGTYKLKFGHRGINQPVLDRTTRKVEITQ